MNKVFLKGNVGQDPKITTFQDSGKVAQFTLATTERGFTTRDGKQIPDVTDWHNIVVKRTGLAGVCEQFVKKGTPLLIVGKIQTGSYEKDGQRVYTTDIIADRVEFLGRPQEANAAQDQNVIDFQNKQAANHTPATAAQASNAWKAINDDDIPF